MPLAHKRSTPGGFFHTERLGRVTACQAVTGGIYLTIGKSQLLACQRHFVSNEMAFRTPLADLSLVDAHQTTTASG